MDVFPRYLSKHPDDSRAHIFYATKLAESGNATLAKKEGERALELSPNDTLMLYNVACLHSRLGEKEKSIEYLTKAFENGYTNYDWLNRDPDLDSIRNEPAFIELMKGK